MTLLRRLAYILDEHQPEQEQAGFVKGFSTTDHIQTLKLIIERYNEYDLPLLLEIGRGVKQCDPLSPKLFIAVLEDILRALDWEDRGLNIYGKRLSHLRFAYNIVLLSEDP
nr:uncharacterized protein LOC116779396 [Danaus plexippus plexippus]